MKLALLGPLLLMTANCSAPGDAQPAAADKLWGTDAHLAPSRPDAVLRYGEHPRAFAELRLPAGDGPFPLAAIYHGGCWRGFSLSGTLFGTSKGSSGCNAAQRCNSRYLTG